MFFMILCYIFGIIIILLFTVLLGIYYNTSQYAKYEEYLQESFYLDWISKDKKKFPSLKDKASCLLSVIIPAYNEEKRLPPMLDETIDFLEEENLNYEIIIVDDGSSDGTYNVGLNYSSKFGSDKIRVLKLIKNRGKGGAVRMGMLKARGQVLLFADADGATKFSDYAKLKSSLDKFCQEGNDISECLGIACGSRAHLEEASIATRSLFRTILMYGFHFLVKIFTVDEIRDTQCGFKLMTRRTAKIIFLNLHLERWAFDVEMLYIAKSLSIPISEIAVNWTEIEGSKVTPVISWIQMGYDLFIIWARYKLGVWKIRIDNH